jgi:hypothetical protein
MDKPVNRIDVTPGTALPAAGTNILVGTSLLTDDIVPVLDPGLLRIYVCISVEGVFSVYRTVGAVSVTENLNSGNPLTAGAAYMFSVPWRAGESINFRYSAAGGIINKLQVDEAWQ